jgi:hypothetical protein
MAALKSRLHGIAVAGALLGLTVAGAVGAPDRSWAQTNTGTALISSSNVAAPGLNPSQNPQPPKVTASPLASPPSSNGGAAPTWFINAIFAALAVLGLTALVWIYVVLRDAPAWHLADALSEDTDMPLKDAAGNPVMNNGSPVLAPVLVSSTSRLIALYGMIAILLLYLGFGAFVLYDIGAGQPLPPNLDKVQAFLVSGLTLFAPYVVNKFASVFTSLAPKSNP